MHFLTQLIYQAVDDIQWKQLNEGHPGELIPTPCCGDVIDGMDVLHIYQGPIQGNTGEMIIGVDIEDCLLRIGWKTNTSAGHTEIILDHDIEDPDFNIAVIEKVVELVNVHISNKNDTPPATL